MIISSVHSERERERGCPSFDNVDELLSCRSLRLSGG